MTRHSFNYYGYSKESYKECSHLIRSTNRTHITILNIWFLFINLLYLVFSYLNLFGVSQERIPFYLMYAVISVGFGAWLLFFPKVCERHIYFSVITSIFILISYGILTSISQPYMPATMFLILLTLISLSYIGNMIMMITISLIAVITFLISSYMLKTFSIAYYDTYNAMIVFTLTIALHYTFQKTRVSQFILYQRDLQIQKELEIKSSFDALTSLLNRGTFFSLAEQILRKDSSGYMALCLLDLDGFKQINDNLGHQMGDKVIQTVGKILMEKLLISKEDNIISDWKLEEHQYIAGRLGGDEFIIFIRGMKSKDDVCRLLQKILDSLNEVRFDNLDGIHASFGATELSATDKDIDNAYKRADEALYESKRAGKNQIHFGER